VTILHVKPINPIILQPIKSKLSSNKRITTPTIPDNKDQRKIALTFFVAVLKPRTIKTH